MSRRPYAVVETYAISCLMVSAVGTSVRATYSTEERARAAIRDTLRVAPGLMLHVRYRGRRLPDEIDRRDRP